MKHILKKTLNEKKKPDDKVKAYMGEDGCFWCMLGCYMSCRNGSWT